MLHEKHKLKPLINQGVGEKHEIHRLNLGNLFWLKVETYPKSVETVESNLA